MSTLPQNPPTVDTIQQHLIPTFDGIINGERQPLVRISGGNRLITTSLAVSHHFGRNHKDVLRAIENLDCSHEFNRRNFTPISYQFEKKISNIENSMI